jgi:hypothetical protein
MKLLLTLSLTLGLTLGLSTVARAAAPAAAIHTCEGLDSIGNLIGHVKEFGQGTIRVAYVSTEEPAAAPDHLLIFVADGEMGATCYAVSESKEGHGFAYVDMSKLTASYDAAKGLLLSVAVSTYDVDAGSSKPAGMVKVRVSRKNGTSAVTIEK